MCFLFDLFPNHHHCLFPFFLLVSQFVHCNLVCLSKSCDRSEICFSFFHELSFVLSYWINSRNSNHPLSHVEYKNHLLILAVPLPFHHSLHRFDAVDLFHVQIIFLSLFSFSHVFCVSHPLFLEYLIACHYLQLLVSSYFSLLLLEIVLILMFSLPYLLAYLFLHSHL